MSVQGWIFKKISKARKNPTMDYHTMRNDFEKLERRIKPPRKMIIERTEIAGVTVEWCSPAGTARNKLILFLHGGSYCFGSVAAYRPFTAGLASRLQLPVLAVDYRLAPENPFPAGLLDVKNVYQSLIDQGFSPQDIIFLGDSAGGGLSVAAAMLFKEQHLPLPSAIALLSPWMDLTMSSESCLQKAATDPINSYHFDKMCAKDYAGSETLINHLISPLYGSYQDLPPLFIHSGTEDIYMDDSIKAAKKAESSGVDVTFKLWEGMFHDFTVLYKLTPEGNASFNELVAFIQKHLFYSVCETI